MSSRPVQLVRAETGHVEIIEFVVVVIADGDTHRPTGVGDARAPRHVLKRPVAAIAV